MGVVYRSVHGGSPPMGDADVGRSIEWHAIKTKSSFQRREVRCPFPRMPAVMLPPRTCTPACGLKVQHIKLPLILWPCDLGTWKPVQMRTCHCLSNFSTELGNTALGQYFVLPCPLSCLRKCRSEFHNDIECSLTSKLLTPFMRRDTRVSTRLKKVEVDFCSSHGFSSLQKNIHNSQGDTFLTKWSSDLCKARFWENT